MKYHQSLTSLADEKSETFNRGGGLGKWIWQSLTAGSSSDLGHVGVRGSSMS